MIDSKTQCCRVTALFHVSLQLDALLLVLQPYKTCTAHINRSHNSLLECCSLTLTLRLGCCHSHSVFADQGKKRDLGYVVLFFQGWDAVIETLQDKTKTIVNARAHVYLEWFIHSTSSSAIAWSIIIRHNWKMIDHWHNADSFMWMGLEGEEKGK